MTEVFLTFIIFLFILAVVVKEDVVFTVLYLFAGAFILGGWWSRKAISAVTYTRRLPNRVFLNEEVPVQLEILNKGWLPLIWLRVHDNLPVELALTGYFRQVFTLGPREKRLFEYKLLARKRGFYRVGPLSAYSGDVLGLLGEQRRSGKPDYLTVYPKIIPLTSLKLPSRSPMGILRHLQPIFEDPSRVLNQRDYIAGDSLRRVDWKTSASVGRLQVKQFEPSIALLTNIFLNLNTVDYDLHSRFNNTELAIVIAASIANWVAQHKQAVGLTTNGQDPLIALKADTTSGIKNLPIAKPVPSRKGQSHLMRILDILARVRADETIPFIDLLRKESIHLSWGTTLILITPKADDEFFDQLFQVRREGLNLVLIMVGQAGNYPTILQRAQTFKIPIYRITRERDLDIWRH